MRRNRSRALVAAVTAILPLLSLAAWARAVTDLDAGPKVNQSATPRGAMIPPPAVAGPGGMTTADAASGVTAADMANALAGPGVTVSNATYVGAGTAGGTFTGGAAIVGLADGVILGTGNVGFVALPINLFDVVGQSNSLPGPEPSLDPLTPATQFDPSVLEFDFFCAPGSVAQLRYVFSSDEYNENIALTDVMGIFLNGVNIALVPGIGLPVNPTTINCGNPFAPPGGSNCNLYRNNDCSDIGPTFAHPCINIITEMDGLTLVLTAFGPLAPGTNHLKIAIADAVDPFVDSNVFLGGGSLTCTPPTGACCDLAADACTDNVLQANCDTNARWSVGLRCEDLPPPCQPPQGCCLGGSCVDISRTECEFELGGVPQGEGTVCTPPVQCCFAGQNCTLLDPLCCIELGGALDTGAPTVACPPAEITVECSDPVPAYDPMFVDDCDVPLDINPISGIVPGDCPAESTIFRAVTATDACGNATTCAQQVNVVDTTNPIITCPADAVVRCTTPLGFLVADLFFEATATDNCDPVVTLFDDRPAFLFPPTCGGPPTVVNFLAVDDCGNFSTCSATVKVEGPLCCPAITDTDLKLMSADVDFRQDGDGPVTTKARFDIWNSNEVRFSGTERCITCWDETRLSAYDDPNHFLLANLQTDHGKARILGEASPDVCDAGAVVSIDTPLLGVAIKETEFAGTGSVEMRSADTLVGAGEQTARIQYDVINAPEESVGPDEGRGGFRIGGSGGVHGLSTPHQSDDNDALAGVLENRASTSHRGSLIYWPVVELKWDAQGTLIQDTILQLANDNASETRVQLYLVNGDAPLPPVIVNGQLLERGHPGWNDVDFQLTLTGDESCYWSLRTGDPKGAAEFVVLDRGNPPGRPDTDPRNPGGRVLRGFMVGWAVNANVQEIRWNHLVGHAVVVNYRDKTAFDYNPWVFRCVASVSEGAEPDAVAGQLNLDGLEYDLAPSQLLFQFFAPGTSAFSHPSIGP